MAAAMSPTFCVRIFPLIPMAVRMVSPSTTPGAMPGTMLAFLNLTVRMLVLGFMMSVNLSNTDETHGKPEGVITGNIPESTGKR